MAETMTDDELDQQMQLLRAHLEGEPGDQGAAENLAVLENVAQVRQGTAQQTSQPAAPAPPTPAQAADVSPTQAPQVTAPDQQTSGAEEHGRGQEVNSPAPGTAPVSPAIAGLPFSLYIDLFTECVYDVNYRVVNQFSNILHLTYDDGTELELDIEQDFTPESMTSDAARDAIADGRTGQGGRIFPAVLAPRTVPRLWEAREDALQIQNEAFADFAKLALTGVVFALFCARDAGRDDGRSRDQRDEGDKAPLVRQLRPQGGERASR